LQWYIKKSTKSLKNLQRKETWFASINTVFLILLFYLCNIFINTALCEKNTKMWYDNNKNNDKNKYKYAGVN